MSIERAELELVDPDNNDLLVHPLTGEALDLAHAPDNQLAAFLADVREHESLLREAKQIVSEEALRRMDQRAEWTIHAAGHELKGASPTPSEEFDELALRDELLTLVEDDVLTIEAVDKAVETVVTFKARKAGLNALRKLGGQVAEVIDRHARRVEKQRYVTVKRLP